MAKAKLRQIKLASGKDAPQPPFPGGWVLAIFKAVDFFIRAAKRPLPISPNTQLRMKAAKVVKQGSYDEVEGKLVELVTALFPKVSIVNDFAKKYVDEYFRLWKQAAEFAPDWARCLGFKPGETRVLGRALVRDLVLRLCYLESCERRLSRSSFTEEELASLGHDLPEQIYEVLISEKMKSAKISQEILAERLRVTARWLRRIKRGESRPSFNLLLQLRPPEAGYRLLAGVGFIDHLLSTLKLGKSEVRNEIVAVARVFFRSHPSALEAFKGSIPRTMKNGAIEFEACDFEGFAAFGSSLLQHPGFEQLFAEMPDALWRCHLYTLQFARTVDLAQAYYQFSRADSDVPLERFLLEAERESEGWIDKLQLRKRDLPLR